MSDCATSVTVLSACSSTIIPATSTEPPAGTTWKDLFLQEVAHPEIDYHFSGEAHAQRARGDPHADGVLHAERGAREDRLGDVPRGDPVPLVHQALGDVSHGGGATGARDRR